MGIKKYQNKGKLSKQWKILIILVAIVLVIFGYFKMFNRSENIVESNKTSEVTKVTDNKTYSASLIACGDVMAHMPQLKAQYNTSTKKYSFDNNYKYVKKYIKNADLAMANLETTLCGDDVYAYSSYPTFNTPDALADSLKNVGFDLLSTINNHSFDMSSLGVERTLSTLKKKGFDTVGTREKKSDDEYVIENVNGIKLGITAYSYGEIKNGTKYLNGIKVSDAGIDIIIGSHPHVVQPVETIKSTDGKKETLVVYSLGNYISNQRREVLSMYTEDGLMVDIDIEKKGNNEATIKKVKCIPTWVDKYQNGSKTVYEIIPIAGNILEKASYVNSSYLKQSYKNTSELIKTDDKISVIKSPFKK